MKNLALFLGLFMMASNLFGMTYNCELSQFEDLMEEPQVTFPFTIDTETQEIAHTSINGWTGLCVVFNSETPLLSCNVSKSTEEVSGAVIELGTESLYIYSKDIDEQYRLSCRLES